jgi:hypothetical protein
MPRYECLATEIRSGHKAVFHRSIEAESMGDAVRVFARYVADCFRSEIEILPDVVRQAFGYSHLTPEAVDQFVFGLGLIHQGEGGLQCRTCRRRFPCSRTFRTWARAFESSIT